HPVGDPELAGLLLRERARPVARAERAPGRRGVGAGEVVALPAAAVIEDARAAVAVADGGQARGHLADRRVPVALLEGAVRLAAERREQPVAPVLVEVELVRLLAGVAARRGVALVAAQADEAAPVELHLEAAVALAQDAGGRLPAHANEGGQSGLFMQLFSAGMRRR